MIPEEYMKKPATQKCQWAQIKQKSLFFLAKDQESSILQDRKRLDNNLSTPAK